MRGDYGIKRSVPRRSGKRRGRGKSSLGVVPGIGCDHGFFVLLNIAHVSLCLLFLPDSGKSQTLPWFLRTLWRRGNSPGILYRLHTSQTAT